MVKQVGVVVPCKNEAATMEACLRSIRAQQPPVARIVVVDNGSDDGSIEIAQRFADEVLVIPEIRIGTMRNRGAAAVGEVDVLAFVDADCVLAPTWLPAALEALEAGADLVGWRSEAGPDDTWVAKRWAAVEARQAHGQSYIWSQHLAIRNDLFVKLDGFDDTLPTGEDVDLSQRVLAGGGRIEFAPGMVAYHHGFPSTLRAFVKRELWHTRAAGWYPRMSTKSRALVVLTGGWALLGLLIGLRSAVRIGRGVSGVSGVSGGRGGSGGSGGSGGTRLPAAWLAGSALGVPALGVVAGKSRSGAVPDGVLLGIWTLVRAARLPREFRRR